MLQEREIAEELVWQTIEKPDRETQGDDNNVHYFKSVTELGGRVLHVVVNPHATPKKVVTAFFDRKARRKR